MLKFTAVQFVDNEDVKGTILVIHQTEILQCCKLYAYIKRNIVPTLNLKQLPYQPQYYPQSYYSQLSNATQDTSTLSLSQQEQNVFEPNTSSFIQPLSRPFSPNIFYSTI